MDLAVSFLVYIPLMILFVWLPVQANWVMVKFRPRANAEWDDWARGKLRVRVRVGATVFGFVLMQAPNSQAQNSTLPQALPWALLYTLKEA